MIRLWDGWVKNDGFNSIFETCTSLPQFRHIPHMAIRGYILTALDLVLMRERGLQRGMIPGIFNRFADEDAGYWHGKLPMPDRYSGRRPDIATIAHGEQFGRWCECNYDQPKSTCPIASSAHHGRHACPSSLRVRGGSIALRLALRFGWSCSGCGVIGWELDRIVRVKDYERRDYLDASARLFSYVSGLGEVERGSVCDHFLLPEFCAECVRALSIPSCGKGWARGDEYLAILSAITRRLPTLDAKRLKADGFAWMRQHSAGTAGVDQCDEPKTIRLILRPYDAAKELGVDHDALCELACTAGFPVAVRLGPRSQGWYKDELVAWMNRPRAPRPYTAPKLSAEVRTCEREQCGAEFHPRTNGRPKRFCSPTCQTSAYNQKYQTR